MHYEGNCIRPPPEAGSILLQVTLGCSHNKCTFCGTYRGKRFRIKDEETILSDIRFASRYMRRQDRVFLMDGDALVIPQKRLVWIMERIREHLPWVKKIGSYGNAKSIGLKSLEDLIGLRKRGMDRIYLGVESGDDRVLKEVNKGADARKLIEEGRKVKEAGIRLTTTVLLGIAGTGERSLAHARATGALLTEVDPENAAALTLILVPGTPLYEAQRRGDFQFPDEQELLIELREMISHTTLNGGVFSSDHASNYLPLRARLPEGRQEILDRIDAALRGEIGLRPEWMRAF
jgi:radical SAM superfamily enzyme YgiQ (UPF0313 family)